MNIAKGNTQNSHIYNIYIYIYSEPLYVVYWLPAYSRKFIDMCIVYMCRYMCYRCIHKHEKIHAGVYANKMRIISCTCTCNNFWLLHFLYYILSYLIYKHFFTSILFFIFNFTLVLFFSIISVTIFANWIVYTIHIICHIQ